MINPLKKICGKIATLCRKRRLKNLQEQYRFDDWHLGSAISRPYVKDIADFVFKNITTFNNQEKCILECGCGLCDIIGNHKLKGYKRIGIDASENVCNAARELHKDILLIHGTFDDIKDLDIEFLIAVNFIHNIPGEEMRMIMDKLTKKNRIHYLIVDEVTGNYSYAHDFNKLMPYNYYCKKIMGPYQSDGGRRYIKVFEKRN